MNPLDKLLDQEEPKSYSVIELDLISFVKNKQLHSSNYTISEIAESLDLYQDQRLFPFWNSKINSSNFHLFFKNEYYKDISINWFWKSEEFDIIPGKFNILENSFSPENKSLGFILNLINPKVIESDISKAKNQMKLIEDDSLILNISLIKTNKNSFEAVLGIKAEDNNKSSWINKCAKPISLILICGILFGGDLANAKNAESKALTSATQAAMDIPEVKRQVDLIKDNLNDFGEKLEESLGENLPAKVVGAGTKIIIDQKIEVGGDFTEKSDYKISVGADGSKVKISVDDLMINESELWFQSNLNKSETKFEIGFKFDF